jgi:thiosulfate reductase/polysulfide reductase chain A
MTKAVRGNWSARAVDRYGEEHTVSENAITRRGFLAGGTGVAAVAVAAGGLGLSGCSKPYSVSEHKDDEPTYRSASGICTACPRLCTYTAYVKQNKVAKLIASASNPSGMGKLCARGYSFSKSAYAENRLTEPLRAQGDGKFEQIDWDTAIKEIGEKLAGASADQIMVEHSSEPTAAFYGNRLAQALGSANAFGAETDYEPSRLGGFAQVLGSGITGWDVDVERCGALLILGTPAHGFSPAQLGRITKACESDCTVVYAGAMRDGVGSHADWWLPVVPGTELGLLLALAHTLIESKLYDTEFIEANTKGFDVFREAMSEYTPEWAEQTLGIDASDIAHLAQVLSAAKPACAVSAQGSFGQGMLSSGEAARMVCAVNTLLGSWNQEGGAQLYRAALPADLGDLAFDAPAASTELSPLAPTGLGGASATLLDGRVNSAIFIGCDPVIDGGNLQKMKSAIGKLGLSVVIDWRMSETARCADYVLPACTDLEYNGMPAFYDAPQPAAGIGSMVIDPVATNARPIDRIVADIASAAGVTGAFDASLDEFAAAELEGWGTSLDNLRAIGSAAAPHTSTTFGTLPDFATESGKIELASDACANVGLSKAPAWIGDTVVNTGDSYSGSLRGFVVALPYQSNANSAAAPGNAYLANKYLGGRVLMNPETAKSLDLEEGSAVTVSSDGGAQDAVVSLASRVMPGVLAIPAGFDSESAQNASEARPVAAMLAGDALETGYGSPANRVVNVTVQKAGA